MKIAVTLAALLITSTAAAERPPMCESQSIRRAIEVLVTSIKHNGGSMKQAHDGNGNVAGHSARISPQNWAMIDFEAKTGFANFLYHCDDVTELVDGMTGKMIAEYSIWSGWKFK